MTMTTKPKTRTAVAARSTAPAPIFALIEKHRAAYEAYLQAIDHAEETKAALPAADRAKDEANAAEIKAAVALCSYPCKTLDDVRIKAEYVLTAPIFSDGLEPDQIEALLQSFISGGGEA
jgi:hypothetical protein